MAKRFGFINTKIYVAKKSYKIRPEPSCFGITSLISDSNQEDPIENHNKVTQSGVWAFNTLKRIAVAKKEKVKNRQMEFAKLIPRKTKTTL